MAKRLSDINRQERQRVWDAMRLAASQRYAAGAMPSWFDPAWLSQEEAPVNALSRAEAEALQAAMRQQQGEPSTASGGGDDGGAGGSWGGGDGGGFSFGGGGWWREDDPYWPLRRWGDHPMRWWTLGFAGLLAAGGLLSTLLSGCTEGVSLGWGAAALLAVAGAAMSDAGSAEAALGVKAAWAICLLLAAKEAAWGWQAKRRSRPRLELTGLLALGMCAGYMLTDMSAMSEVSLPTNPGAVFKSPDVAYRSSVWNRWGYGGVQMRV
ncbi:hypothetical protein HYH03_015145 [Edaphochlamys debaryana]|uniref:Uncharacterized protein n=1 Tax=Edaphochlamys debaryana TaxID=47281 RepID=A0A835XK13_9CHLO|nr:hypothetical protein HYH03_015145 [Edaphochlamys debaryana]|eukprot:KAG2486182.1 hypothetical protein HYH03_015145 [Edaphochlamys debaryana]